MTITPLAKLVIAALPGGLLVLALHWALACRHSTEVACILADGARGLRCQKCRRERAHPWAGAPIAYTLRYGPAPRFPLRAPTGIEREGRVEWNETKQRIKQRVERRFGSVA